MLRPGSMLFLHARGYLSLLEDFRVIRAGYRISTFIKSQGRFVRGSIAGYY